MSKALPTAEDFLYKPEEPGVKIMADEIPTRMIDFASLMCDELARRIKESKEVTWNGDKVRTSQIDSIVSELKSEMQ